MDGFEGAGGVEVAACCCCCGGTGMDRLVGVRAERSGGGWIGARTYGSEDLEVFEDCCVAVGSVLRR